MRATSHAGCTLQIKEFHSYCGGLPAPECADNPLNYKFSWSPRGGLLVLLNDSAYLAHGQRVTVPGGKDLMSVAELYSLSPSPSPADAHAQAFVAFPNRDAVPFREFYRIPEAETVVRGTLRYPGFPEFVRALVALGWMSAERREWLREGMTWAEVFQHAVGAADADERCVYALAIFNLFLCLPYSERATR